MKIYQRTDGFQVHDCLDRSIDWVTEKYGGSWIELPVPEPK